MLLLKIIIAPVLIALVSLAGRKWGPGIAGWLLGLPLNSGPILFFLLLEQGPRFAAEATRGSLLGILAWASFCLVYAFCCLRMSWWASTLVGWIAYLVVAWTLLPLTLTVVWAFVLVTVTLSALLLIFPKAPQTNLDSNEDKQDLWLRMATASVMVVTLTGVARMLGPTRSGLLTAFPAYTTILAVFTNRHGAASAIRAMKGVTAGLYTAATFFLVLSFCLQRLGNAWSFVWASAAALTVHTGSLLFVRRSVPVLDRQAG
ncbi:MAG TPA: hypothetical protein VKE93_20350 [Candidatus Angelobacter sp.]|nr:hypothetical protein [Candidatus Angelobacter sp.]